MTQPNGAPDEFVYIAAAQNAAESVQPGNELQKMAVADIMRLAFEQEVRKAFPNKDVSQA